MKKIDELKRTVDDLKKQVTELQASGQIDEAEKVSKELKSAVADYHVQEALDAVEMASLKNPLNKTQKAVDARLKNRVFNKFVFNARLNDEEKAYVDAHGAPKFINAVGTPGLAEGTPAKGGYIVPEEQLAVLREYTRGLQVLKNYCGVRTVSSDSGKYPTIGSETGKLIAFDELNEINQDDLDFGQVAFSIGTYGDIIPVANTLLADTNIDLMGLIGRRFATKAVNTENEKIIAKLPASSTAITDYKGIKKALNVTLDPLVAAGARIFTNQDGYDYLDELTDSNGRPLLTQSLADPSVYAFAGHEVVVISNSILTTVSQALPFYVGNMEQAVAYFDRAQVAVAADSSAGFTKNATLVRAIERFDVEADDAGAMAFLKLTVSST